MATDKLLKATADAFEEMRMLDGNFLTENNVSREELFQWYAQLAAIINGYLSAPKDMQNLILASGVAPESAMSRIIWETGINQLKMERLLQQPQHS